jgi:HD-GYP domain-containing protein (c-di-GMP phosphodiesterase class II)
VADIYDALTSERPYRPAMTTEVALATLERERGEGVAGDCLEALVKVVQEAERPAA